MVYLRSHPIDIVPAPRSWEQQQNHPSPTIGRTNVDAIQPPFQQLSLSKNSAVNGHPGKNNKKMTLSKSEAREISEQIISDFLESKRCLEATGNFLSGLKMQRK